MWSRWLSLLCVVALSSGALRAEPDLRESAFRAQALLGPDTWSEVVKIKNQRPGAEFPSVVYALVFELEGRLWFYAANSGTESLSLERGRLERDKRALGPLLREIHAGFSHYEVLPPSIDGREGSAVAGVSGESLPHGCFIESIVYLRQRVAAGENISDARLLAYYADSRSGRRGHTVLYFEREGRRYYFDPAAPAAARMIPRDAGRDAMGVAQAAAPERHYAPPQRAVFLPLRNSLVPPMSEVRPAL